MSHQEHESGSSGDDAFYARIRDLARGERAETRGVEPPAASAAGPDEPLELTAVVGASKPVPAPMKPKTLAERLAGRPPGTLAAANVARTRPEPGAVSEPSEVSQSGDSHSIANVLARLDAREQDLAAAGRGTGTTVSSRPLDQIVEEVLRPILADWLDRNLERIVRDQVDAALQAELAARERGRPADD